LPHVLVDTVSETSTLRRGILAFLGFLAYSRVAHRSQECRPEDDATMATNGNDMNARLARVETKLDQLDKKVERLETTVTDLGNATKTRFEDVREDIKKLGEGYEQGLKAIASQIAQVGRQWEDKWIPHDLAIKDHGRRITALERRRHRKTPSR
jgi:predicted nuclease with TOPRIM domain